MKVPYRQIAGVALGCVLSAVVLGVWAPDRNRFAEPQWQVLAECEGSLKELAIHYAPEAADAVMPVYRSFLSRLAPDVVVYVVCSSQEDFEQFTQSAGCLACRLTPTIVGHPVTCWSRDRWLALQAKERRPGSLLVTPWAEMGAESWPAREGDERVAEDLAAAHGQSIQVMRSRLYFDGGDFVTDAQSAFVTPAVIRRNVHQTVPTCRELQQCLEKVLARRVVLLDEAPDHHAGMFMMSAGNRTVLVGDPAEGRRLWDRLDEPQRNRIDLPGGPDFSDPTIRRFEAVAERCRNEGYRVVRVPTVTAADGRTYLTYVNVILDLRGGRRVVYLPCYAGADPLNERAAEIWASLGYEVQPVDCTSIFRHFGALRCLVNVVSRSSTGAPQSADTGSRRI